MQKSSVLLPNPDNIAPEQLADKINDNFVAVMQDHSSILASDLRMSPHNDQTIQMQPSDVYSKMSKVHVQASNA